MMVPGFTRLAHPWRSSDRVGNSLFHSFTLSLFALSLSKNCDYIEKIRIIVSFDSFSLLFPSYAQERMDPVSFYKRATVNDLLFFKSKSLFRYFAYKNRAIRSKNQRANSQHWENGTRVSQNFKNVVLEPHFI